MGGATQPPRPQNAALQSEQGSGQLRGHPKRHCHPGRQFPEASGAQSSPARARGAAQIRLGLGTQGADSSSCEASERSLPGCTRLHQHRHGPQQPPSAPDQTQPPMEAAATPHTGPGSGSSAGGLCCRPDTETEGLREPREGRLCRRRGQREAQEHAAHRGALTRAGLRKPLLLVTLTVNATARPEESWPQNAGETSPIPPDGLVVPAVSTGQTETGAHAVETVHSSAVFPVC